MKKQFLFHRPTSRIAIASSHKINSFILSFYSGGIQTIDPSFFALPHTDNSYNRYMIVTDRPLQELTVEVLGYNNDVEIFAITM